MSAPDRPRYEHAEARAVAVEIARELKPACNRILIAGSLRRRKATVGDVEILYIPRWEEERDLLGAVTGRRCLTDVVLNELLAAGILARRPNVNGATSWGSLIKYAVHVASGIPVDLFATTVESWWNYLVCRTGPADSNTRICEAAQRRGWKWKPYSCGFCKLEDGEETHEFHAVQSEAEVFEFVGLPYAEPAERR